MLQKKHCLFVGTYFLFFLTYFSSTSLFAATKPTAVEAPASQQAAAEESQGRGTMSTFLAEHITFGGFFEHAVTFNDSTVHSYQLSANSHILGLNLGVKLNDKFRFTTQELVVLTFPFLNEHDATLRAYSNTPAIAALVAHAYGEYTSSEKFKIQTGLGWAPFGIMCANREFPLYLRRNGPQIASGGLSIPYAIWTGLQFLGEFDAGASSWGYHVYSATPTTDANMLGGGARLWWQGPNDHIKLGTSAQILDRGSDTVFNLGTDVELKVNNFGLRAEYAQSIMNGEDIWTAYGQPYVELDDGKWVIHADVDYANRPLHATETASATVAAFEKWELGGGVNYLPWNFLRLRLLFLYNNYVGASATVAGVTNDYYTVEYSAGIEF